MFDLTGIFVAGCLAILLNHILRAHFYWWWRGVRGPVGWPLFGSFYDVASSSKPRCFVLNNWTQKFGEMYGYLEGVVPVLVISNVEMIEELFVSKFDNFSARKLTNMIHGDLESTVEEPIVNLFIARGSRWRRQRRLAARVFTAPNLRETHWIVEDSVREMMQFLDKANKVHGINIHQYYQEFTCDVISRLAMGEPSRMFNNGGVDIVKSVLLRSHRVYPWYLAVAFPAFQYYVKKVFYNHENIRGGDIGQLFMMCHTAVTTRIAQREKAMKNGEEIPVNDYIDFLLDHVPKHVDEYGVERKTAISDVIGACFVFLLAGFDTTANTLACASYLLAKNQDAMRRAQEEIAEVVGNEDVSFAHTDRMHYLKAVVKETLRLSPVGYFACSRECVTPTTLGGVHIEKGVQVEVDVIAVHKDKAIWGDDVEEFVPERWLGPQAPHRMSWIPFGAGRRQCVGKLLGYTEAITALTHVLRKYNLRTGPNTEEKLRLFGCTTTSPESVTLYLDPRD